MSSIQLISKQLQAPLKYIFSLCSLLFLFGSALFFFYFSNGANLKGFLAEDLTQANRTVSKAFLPPSEYGGWIAWWDEADTTASLSKYQDKLTSVSPVWYKIDSTGVLTTIPHSFETEIKVLSHDAKIALIPTITNDFEAGRTSTLLHSHTLKTQLISDLILLAKNAGYQGYDVDFEEINPLDQPAFEEFIQQMAREMHKEDLLVTVSVHAQTGKHTDREVAKAFNLAKLAESADFIKIMAYDFHHQNSMAGAITPLTSLEMVLEHVSTIVPTQKIILGLPTYGYDWNTSDGGSAQVVTYKEATDKVASFSGRIDRDKYSKSLVGKYQSEGKYHEIWFEDAETIEMFVTKARTYGIYQFSFWRLGAEDPKLWQNTPKKSLD